MLKEASIHVCLFGELHFQKSASVVFDMWQLKLIIVQTQEEGHNSQASVSINFNKLLCWIE